MEGEDKTDAAPQEKKEKRTSLLRILQRHEKVKLKGLRQSASNPYMNILNQHQEHRFRVFKIIFVVFILMLMAGGSSFLFHQWKIKKEREDFLNTIKNRILEIDESIRNSPTVYRKDSAAVEGAALSERAALLDIGNARAWVQKNAEYLGMLGNYKPSIESGKAESFINASVLADMISIPAGQFYMGKRSGESGLDSELPRHSVLISREFWIAKHEITNAQFRRFFPFHRSGSWNSYTLDKQSQPVVNINWHVAMTFCKMITERESAAGRLPSRYEYRLPTEAEWEYACRSGTDSAYYWGQDFGATGAKYANVIDLQSIRMGIFKVRAERDMAPDDGFRVSAPVGSFLPNAFGLYDISGNVSEWCYDWYNPRAYRELAEVDPVQTKPIEAQLRKPMPFDAGYFFMNTPCKVIRGGNYGNVPTSARCAARDYFEPNTNDTGIGFRIVLAPIIRPAKD
ncbi:MAG: hypothetical protein A2020_03770 [Lentisphaerae bacterium GWF2_45_14]|nr:MAG: hypothetical protein A2020_03770 [Lentisphaerae bacterium GWF2_45_14]